jgi:hypothetical protein
MEYWNAGLRLGDYVGIMGIGLRLRRDLSPLEPGITDKETIALK